MKRHLAFSLAFFLFFSKSYAEEAPYGMDELLLRTNLIAYIKITRHAPTYFRAQVLGVLHHHKSGIQKGDYLKIVNDFSRVCPASFPIEYAEQKKEALVFLSYHQNKWYLTQGQIKFIKNGKIQLHFNEEEYAYTGTLTDWKNDLADYFGHFSYDTAGKICSRYTEKSIGNKQFSDLVYLQYKAIYYNLKLSTRQCNNLTSTAIYVK